MHTSSVSNRLISPTLRASASATQEPTPPMPTTATSSRQSLETGAAIQAGDAAETLFIDRHADSPEKTWRL